MPNKEDNTDQTQEQEVQKQAESNADDVRIVEAMKPSSAPSPKKPLRYGTRRGRPGAKAPAVIPISSISKELVEEEIEMDDLPVKANAPDHLIDSNSNPSEHRRDDGEDRRRRSDRPRGERRRRDDRERNPEYRRSSERDTPEAKPEEAAAAPAASAETSEDAQAADRPARFGMVSPTEGRARAGDQVKEFRPSRDGRTSDRSEKTADNRRSSKPRSAAKKTSFLSKVIAFFTGEPKEEAKTARPARPRQDRSRRGPQDRQQGEEGDDRRRKRRPRNRNRKPRPEGADAGNGPRSQSGEGGQRRRRRRPRRDGRQGGEGRERGRRDQERAPSGQ